MTFNTDPVGFINSDEYKFYKNFPQAWPGGAEQFAMLTRAVDILKVDSKDSRGGIDTPTKNLLKERGYVELGGLWAGLYALKLLSLGREYALHDLLILFNICLVGLTKTGYSKLKVKNKLEISTKVLDLFDRIKSTPLKSTEVKELILLLKTVTYYEIVPKSKLPTRRHIIYADTSWYEEGSRKRLDRGYLNKIEKFGAKLLPQW